MLNTFYVLCIDGAFQRAHPGRHAAGEEDHSDGHCRPGAREVKITPNNACAHTPYLQPGFVSLQLKLFYVIHMRAGGFFFILDMSFLFSGQSDLHSRSLSNAARENGGFLSVHRQGVPLTRRQGAKRKKKTRASEVDSAGWGPYPAWKLLTNLFENPPHDLITSSGCCWHRLMPKFM